MTPESLHNILSRTFTLFGHSEDQFNELSAMFITGLMGQMQDNPKCVALQTELDSALEEEASPEAGNDLMKFLGIVQKHEFESEFAAEFLTYLKKYSDHVRPSLPEEKVPVLDEILDDAEILVENTPTR